SFLQAVSRWFYGGSAGLRGASAPLVIFSAARLATLAGRVEADPVATRTQLGELVKLLLTLEPWSWPRDTMARLLALEARCRRAQRDVVGARQVLAFAVTALGDHQVGDALAFLAIEASRLERRSGEVERARVLAGEALRHAVGGTCSRTVLADALIERAAAQATIEIDPGVVQDLRAAAALTPEVAVERAKAWRALTRVRLAQGELACAREDVKRAWAAMPKAPSRGYATRGRGTLLCLSGEVAYRLGEHDDAIDAWKQAFDLFVVLDDRPGQVLVTARLIRLHLRRHDSRAAGAATRRLLPLMARLPKITKTLAGSIRQAVDAAWNDCLQLSHARALIDAVRADLDVDLVDGDPNARRESRRMSR
ncbi:MAG: hypothetical protein AAGD38_21200, partial [Acidobacteriota bacterium]